MKMELQTLFRLIQAVAGFSYETAESTNFLASMPQGVIQRTPASSVREDGRFMHNKVAMLILC